MNGMERTSIFVPAPLKRRLEAYTERTGKSAALVIREALAEYLDEADSGRPRSWGVVSGAHVESDMVIEHRERWAKEGAEGGPPD